MSDAPASAPRRIVVIGSGLAGFGVLRELRRLSPEAHLFLVTREDGHFYSKPALSTALAKGKLPESLITSPAEKIVAQLRIDARIGREAESIDRHSKALCTSGGPLPYDSLILATGAAPVRPAMEGSAAHRALSVNQLDHYAQFRRELPDAGRVLIIGAGLVGTEFANDLVTTGYRPVVVDMLDHPLARLVPEPVGHKIVAALEEAGVEWHLGRKVVAINYSEPGPGYNATLDDGSVITCDLVLSALGLRPEIALAKEAGLDVGAGIKVDEFGRTSDPSIFAIGDCAEYRHGLSAYVTPIMAAARGIAPTSLGTPTPIKFPPLAVQVKTTLLPINLLPPFQGTSGAWLCIEDNDDGSMFLFLDPEGVARGYVLTGNRCEQRSEMDLAIGQPWAATGSTS